MEMNALTLDDLLLPEWGEPSFAPFEPCATYFAAMDCIVYLKEDEAFRADRIDQFLTLLWHPHDDRVIGVKMKGMRYLFDSVRTIVKTTTGTDLSNDKFFPLVAAIQMALQMEAGANFSERLGKDRLNRLKEINDRYDTARGIVDGATFDVGQIS